ncbi:hypothetical protein SCHPADRAFT_934502 [Schizopora paradoxa]|uniref:Uncharacterized protein n=1 Tax=Schizopora paradoxa TaxID=27342 RepID=A0A0H2S8W4_9AGAM|nr:hypothetical protein SCHPADRAFT_934502 [Schizopora paradoxa]
MSAIHPPQPSHSAKQWWSKVPTPKASTISHRPPKITTDVSTLKLAKSPTPTPTPTPSEERTGGRSRSNSAIKFNTLTSVFRKKTLHIPSNQIEITAGPVSPPLPFQNPPPSAPPPQRRTTKISTASINSSICGPLSPGEPSIFTLPSSSDDASEPITPSDGSRHRTSYQPSFFTFAEPDKHASIASADSLGPRYFVPRMSRVSVRSDPSSFMDSQSTNEPMPKPLPPSSRALPHSYRPSRKESKSKVDLSHKRKSSGDAQPNFGFSNHRSSFESKSQEKRFSDTSMPPMPNAGLLPASRTIRKSPSALPSISSISTGSISTTQMSPPLTAGGRGRSSQEMVLIDQAFSFDSDGESDILRDIKDEIADAHDAFIDDTASILSQVRLTSIYPSKDHRKVSAVSKRDSNSERTSVALSLPSPTSVNSHPGSGSISPPLMSPGTLSTSTSSSSLSRKTSSIRLRPVPPSRTPPPLSGLPPTPNSQPPSPLTFRRPKSGFSSGLPDGGGSILSYDLPPSTPSSESESSSASLCFAHPEPITEAEFGAPILTALSSRQNEARNIPQALAKHGRPAPRENFARRTPLHSSKPSTTSSQAHTITAATARGETPTPRSLRKSLSQSSFSVSVSLSHRERPRVDSTTSTSSAQRSEESVNSSGVHYTVSSIGKALRKQRSLHNTRAAANMLIPPLPPMLRHASSFTSASDNVDNEVAAVSSTPPTSTSFHISKSSSSSRVVSPSTPPTQRKRMLFRDRRDSSQNQNDRERDEVRELHTKKSLGQAAGLGISLNIFSNPFGPNPPPLSPPERPVESAKITPPRSISPPPTSPADALSNPLVDQHILPPAELLSQMEALADMEEPASPLLFSDKSLEYDDDEWSLDSSSVADKRSLHSTVGSIGGASVAFGQSDLESAHSSPVLRARQVSSSNMPSIQSRLQSEQRPSSSSKIPMRRSSLIGAPQRARPSTAQALQEGPSRRDTFGLNNAEFVSTALPPPPRRPGKAIVSPLSESYADDEERDEVSSSMYTASSRSTVRHMQSHETFNPNRGSIFRKPSFLNIDDDVPDISSENMGGSILNEVPEDSFLILERSKDSLDLSRSYDEHSLFI